MVDERIIELNNINFTHNNVDFIFIKEKDTFTIQHLCDLNWCNNIEYEDNETFNITFKLSACVYDCINKIVLVENDYKLEDSGHIVFKYNINGLNDMLYNNDITTTTTDMFVQDPNYFKEFLYNSDRGFLEKITNTIAEKINVDKYIRNFTGSNTSMLQRISIVVASNTIDCSYTKYLKR